MSSEADQLKEIREDIGVIRTTLVALQVEQAGLKTKVDSMGVRERCPAYKDPRIVFVGGGVSTGLAIAAIERFLM